MVAMNFDVLRERYLRLCEEPSDINEHLATFVKAVVNTEAQTVIELGVRYGLSTIGWLYGLNATGGHLWSVDCSWPVTAPGAVENLLDPQGPLGVCENWTFILGYDTWPATLDALPNQCDILFIDTNHVYEETLIELELYYPRVKRGGRIYLHDTAIETTGNATTPQPPFPVKTAVEEFCRDHNLRFENVTNCSGLGTIYV